MQADDRTKELLSTENESSKDSLRTNPPVLSDNGTIKPAAKNEQNVNTQSKPPVGINVKQLLEHIILGTNPGTTIMGFGIIGVESQRMKPLQPNELQLSKYNSHYIRLGVTFNHTLKLIDTYHPNKLVTEAPPFGKNVQLILKLGCIQGAAIAAGLSREAPITEYEPKKVKMTITGNGVASEEQVAKVLQRLLGLKELPKHFNAADGLAVAICHYFSTGKIEKQQSYSGWEALVKQDQDRTG